MPLALYQQYFVLVALAVGAMVFALVPLLIAYVLSPKKPSKTKNQTYECGLISSGDPWVQFKLQYYLYALAFVLFDIEAIFIYPWAVAFTGIGIGGFIAMAIFILILIESLIYLWGKGLLEWE
tara:strand:- start:64 stop:432 length:369 start_codon:yes stop_codon:yes gene_type:complete